MIETQNLNNLLEKLIDKSIEKFSYRIEDMVNDSSFEVDQLPEVLNNLGNIMTLIDGVNHFGKMTGRKFEDNNVAIPEIVKVFFGDMINTSNRKEPEPKKRKSKKDDK
jgi:hypothetical protein